MNDLKKRKGFTILSMDFIRGGNVNLLALKAMYSVFYPIAMYQGRAIGLSSKKGFQVGPIKRP